MTHLFLSKTGRAWCGRKPSARSHLTRSLTAVECEKCREAFARELASLEDVFPVPDDDDGGGR